jgi:hypothetical protein
MILRLLFGNLLVALLHFAIGSLLYYGRIKDVSPILGSDLVVFVFPLIAAFAGYFAVSWCSGLLADKTGLRITLAIVVSLVASAISTYGMILFILNKFGS